MFQTIMNPDLNIIRDSVDAIEGLISLSRQQLNRTHHVMQPLIAVR